ncbi:MAG: SPFH domain-containing protein [Tissierellia bacterium]|nr:SPFH domain-containing protein [Tissierellia bacterium]
MGIIKATLESIRGSLADQWLEAIEADDMGGSTVFTSGKFVREGKGSNTKGTSNIVTDGSIIHVNQNQFMILTDGGKVIDYTAEPGYYKVDNNSAPSLFNGDFGQALRESFNRIKFGGTPPLKQEVYFINTQEIKGIKFGTRNAINYFDNFYNSELFLRTHGTYSIKVTDPLLFFAEVIPRNARKVEIEEINEQYLSEFLEALQAAINRLSVEGTRISFVVSKSMELSKYMREVLDDEWREKRGMEVQSVGIASISYDEESQKLINMRNQGAMLGDARVREGYVQGSVARGMEAAGSNPGGAAQSYMGMGIGLGTAGNVMGGFSTSNMEQMRQEEAARAQQTQGEQGGAGKQLGEWFCPECGTKNSGNFCTNCGTKKPEQGAPSCRNCGYTLQPGQPEPKFCPECGNPFK